MKGISVYPNKSSVADCINYIDKAADLGFSRLFTSLLELTEDQSKTLNKFKTVLTHARARKMWVSLDVNPALFTSLHVSYNDLSFFKELGADVVRLDSSFDGLPESVMTYNPEGLTIEVNISNDTKNLENILSYSPIKDKIIGCHNFYPQRYTGLDTEYFLNTTKKYHDLGLRTAAFISSNSGKIGPHPYNAGLPTLEIHRGIPIEKQAQYLINTQLIDDILIGNAFASDEELQKVAKLSSNIPQFFIDFVPTATELEREIVLKNLHFNRGDINSYAIRSTFVKLKYNKQNIPVNNPVANLKRGMITIGNNDFKQYKGELNIVKQNMDNHDHLKNVVAQIVPSDLQYIDFIKPWDKFKFIELASY